MVTRAESDDSVFTWTPAAIARACGGRVVRTGKAARSITTDSRRVRARGCFVAIRGDRMDGHDYVEAALASGAAGCVVDRSLDGLRVPEGAFVVRVDDTRVALLALGNAHRRRSKAAVVGITGSCGKTSVKDMLAHVLGRSMPTVAAPASFNNDIGVPLTLFGLRPMSKAAVVEIGTSAPGEVERLAAVAEPTLAIVTCVAPAHLDRLGSVEGVAREKSSILRPGGRPTTAILNADDVECRKMADAHDGPTLLIGLGRPADVDEIALWAEQVRFCGIGTSFLVRGAGRYADECGLGGLAVTVPRLGTHNVHNALLSLVAAAELGVPLAEAAAALASLPTTERRLERRVVGGITLFDDSYNMNPSSARAGLLAMRALPDIGRRVVVFGGMAELGTTSEELHFALGEDIAGAEVASLVTVGPEAAAIADGAESAGLPVNSVVRAESVAEATERLLALVEPGDLVLVKASRSFGLDRLVDDLGRLLDEQQRHDLPGADPLDLVDDDEFAQLDGDPLAVEPTVLPRPRPRRRSKSPATGRASAPPSGVSADDSKGP